MEQKLTHINEDGDARMVDVSDKAETKRIAVATGFISMKKETYDTIVNGTAKKGDVLAAARIAGIMAAKKTSDLIPLCHPLALTKVEVKCTPEIKACGKHAKSGDSDSSTEANAENNTFGIRVESTCALTGKTGVEIEAITATSIALVTIYDMCKAIDRGMIIENVQVLHKEGGKSGTWDFEQVR